MCYLLSKERGADIPPCEKENPIGEAATGDSNYLKVSAKDVRFSRGSSLKDGRPAPGLLRHPEFRIYPPVTLTQLDWTFHMFNTLFRIIKRLFFLASAGAADD
jgi:hypothetical protein